MKKFRRCVCVHCNNCTIAMASIDGQHMFQKLKDMDAIFYMSIQSLISCCRLVSY